MAQKRPKIAGHLLSGVIVLGFLGLIVDTVYAKKYESALLCDQDHVPVTYKGNQYCVNTDNVRCFWRDGDCSPGTFKALAVAELQGRKIVDYDMGCGLKTTCLKDTNSWRCLGPMVYDKTIATNSVELCPQ